MSFLEAVEGFGGLGVGRFVRVDEEGFGAVSFLDVGFGDAGLEVEHRVGVELEDGEDAVDFAVLVVSVSTWVEEDRETAAWAHLVELLAGSHQLGLEVCIGAHGGGSQVCGDCSAQSGVGTALVLSMYWRWWTRWRRSQAPPRELVFPAAALGPRPCLSPKKKLAAVSRLHHNLPSSSSW